MLSLVEVFAVFPIVKNLKQQCVENTSQT
uniref:Uncharacterized protein n=1 Tax=Anguilla anguilla TaxID=7936 RepID=A0A0E9VSS4_ANGAN